MLHIVLTPNLAFQFLNYLVPLRVDLVLRIKKPPPRLIPLGFQFLHPLLELELILEVHRQGRRLLGFLD